MPQRHTLLALALTGAMMGAPLAAQQKPTLKPADYQKWESLGATRISPDGKWVAVGINRVSDENELRIRGGARDTTITTALAISAAFTNDSRWIGYLVQLPPKEREKLTKERKPIRTSFGARDLTTGVTIELADVSAFSFSADGRFVALTRYPAEGKRVQEVVVQDLRSGTRWSFGNVGEHSWSEVRALLAFTVNVEGGVGSSFQLFDGDAGSTRVLDASSSMYRAIGWRTKAADVAVLRSIGDKAFADTANAVLAWRNANESAAAAVTFDPATTTAGLAKDLRIAEGRRPSWSRDGATLFIGLQSRLDTAAMPKKSTEKVSDVEIWHPNDVRVIPQQRSSESQDLRATRVAAWKLGAATVTPLGSDAMEQQVLLTGDRYLIEIDTKPYAWGTMFGRRDQDVWIVDVTDGSRKKLLEKIRFVLAPDPTGRRVAWFDGKDYWAAEIASGKRTNLTAPLTGARRVDFVDRDDDHPSDVLSPIGGPTWSRDGERFLVYDQVDLWSLALDGSGGTKLTDGAGEQLEHRLYSFAGFNASAVDRSVDLTKPVYLSLYGRRTKKSGYARLANGRVERLLLADAAVGALAKADSTDRYTFTRQTFVESPNVFAAGADLANPSRLTNTNPFQSDYAWGKAELMDFTSTVGKRLQAILYYPANYDPSKKYPMIVYTYELLSQGLHGYITPREYSYYNANNFTQLGYFVLMPDIVFRPREPGVSVLHAVEPAVRAVLARGLVDPAKVGHMGHSQGGYEAAFLATHSTLFKTAVMGAGISDMFSFAGQMHWSSVPEFDHWETGQFRMQVPPWEDWESMRRNNPIERVHDMPAQSILIEIGGDDPTVDMRQGVEFYNYARRAGKQAVMLLYPGEGHGLGKRENAIDYHRRIVEWFGYYLKGEPPAKWITDGQTWIERKRILDVNK